MSPPRYKPRSHYHTRRSSGEPSGDPGAYFDATSLDRPKLEDASLAPRRALPSVGKFAGGARPARPAYCAVGSWAWLRMTAIMVVVACALAGSMMGTLLAISGA